MRNKQTTFKLVADSMTLRRCNLRRLHNHWSGGGGWILIFNLRSNHTSVGVGGFFIFLFTQNSLSWADSPLPLEKGQRNASFQTWLCGSPCCSLNVTHQITSWTTAWSVRKGKVGGKWMALSNKTLRSNANRFSCINANVWRSPCHVISHCGG